MNSKKDKKSTAKGDPMSTVGTRVLKSARADGVMIPRVNNDSPQGLLTLSEAAEMLGRVHRTTIMRWVREDRLKCVRLSRKVILFERDEINRFVREHRAAGQ